MAVTTTERRAVPAAKADAFVTVLAAGAALGGLLFGFDTSTMSSAMSGVRATMGLSSSALGFVAAIALIGCAVGAWFAGPIAARLGRDRVMLLAGLLILVGSLAVAISSDAVPMGFYRFVTGLGIGAASAVVPAYVAEIAPARIRGRLGTFWQLAIVFGQLVGLLAGLGWTAWAGSESEPIPWGGAAWRWMFVVVGVLAAAYVLIARARPRSPHDAVRLGHEDEARALLGRIGTRSVESAIAAMREKHQGESGFPSLRDLRGRTLGLKRLVWIGILLAAFQQLVGINVAKTYSNALWQAVGLATGTAFTASIVTVLVSIASTIVAIAIVDEVGRRTLLLSGAALMVVSLLALAVCFSTAQASGSELVLERGPGIGALIAMNVFAVAFGVSWGPVMWLMLGELFDGNLRTSAVAVCTAVHWMTHWAVTHSFPPLAGVGLSFVYGLYTVFAALAFVFALKMLPETRGRTLQ